MANIFIDTNLFFDLAYRNEAKSEALKGHNIYVSPLSMHIYCYSEHVRLPDKTLESFIDNYIIIDLSKNILKRSLKGPTSDLEDNIQLHSAAKCEADYFLTNDKKLLNMKFFGKTKILPNI
jgi:predicted nucleic acid-binding protein